MAFPPVFLSSAANRFIWLVLSFVAFAVCFYLSWTIFVSDVVVVGGAIALAMVMGLTVMMTERLFGTGRIDLTESLTDNPPRILICVITAGVILRILYFVFTYPWPNVSDAGMYLEVAERLWETGSVIFREEAGITLRAYRPPGYIFFISPFAGLAVDNMIGAFIAHCIIFVLAAIALYTLISELTDRRLGILVAILFSFWPNDIFYTGVAHTELLSTLLIAISTLYFFKAMWRDRWWWPAALAGAVMGLLALTKSPFLIFPMAWVLYLVMARYELGKGLLRVAVMIVAMALVIAPWMVRNYYILDALVPVSTNGGIVFYKSNNPLATGGWTLRGERDPVDVASTEASRDKVAYEWGKEWIKNNPIGFLKLVLAKQRIFLGADDAGAFYTYARFLESDTFGRFTPEEMQRNPFVGMLLTAISNVWWYFAWTLIAAALIRWRHVFLARPDLLFLTLPFLFLLTVHSVFESQPRYHIPGIGFVLFFVAAALMPRDYFIMEGAKPRQSRFAANTNST